VNTIQAAPVDGSFKATGKQKTNVPFDVNKDKMEKIYSAKKVIFTVSFTTNPNTTHLKIYSNYGIDFKIVGDINYSVQ
jgi:hypothetical protein